MIIHNPILTGSFTVNGTDVSSITSSAASLTSLNAYTASQNNRNGTYATTGSNTFAGIQTVNSNLVVTGSITAQTLVVQTITSSVDFVTGSTRFGSLLTNTHVFSGSVSMNPGGLFVSGSGRVGINTTNPLSLFDITVLTGGARRLLVNYDDSLVTIKSANDSATAESLRVWGDNIYFYTGSAGSELMRLTNTGRVGIGTTTPDGKLHIFGKTYARYGQDDMFAFYYDDNYRFGITNPSTDLRQLRVFTQAIDNVGFIVFATANNVERMRITSGGNTEILSGNVLNIYRTDNARALQLYTTANECVIDSWEASSEPLMIRSNGTGGRIVFHTNGAERARISSNGGFTSDCNAGGTNSQVFINSASSNPYGPWFRFNTDPNNGTNYFWVASAIVSGSEYVRAKIFSNGGLANYQAYDTNLSDERTKKDIIPLESYWNKFKAIEIVKFKYKDQTHDDFNIGVIAQQVENVAPEFVDVDGWGETPEDEIPLKSVYTADLHHATIKVLQEAMAKIEVLEAEINELKNK